jgi:ubiquinone/menaquinone biosynthesis C-methylase UbiE
MTRETKKWWEEVSEGYQKECNIPIGIHYGPGAPFEDELKLLGNIKEKKILEIGCGGAQCGIAMAKKGAKVIGIDISEKQLEFARELAKKNKANVTFYQGDVRKLNQIKSKSQDIVFSAWALFYIDDLKSCFKEVHRVLKPNGVFVLSMPHPIYFTLNPKTLKLEKSYFKTGKYVKIEKWMDGKEHKFVSYKHTVSDLINLFIKTDFQIEEVIEPDSRKHYPKDPWYNIWEFTPELMAYVPPTIIFKARKVK